MFTYIHMYICVYSSYVHRIRMYIHGTHGTQRKKYFALRYSSSSRATRTTGRGTGYSTRYTKQPTAAHTHSKHTAHTRTGHSSKHSCTQLHTAARSCTQLHTGAHSCTHTYTHQAPEPRSNETYFIIYAAFSGAANPLGSVHDSRRSLRALKARRTVWC